MVSVIEGFHCSVCKCSALQIIITQLFVHACKKKKKKEELILQVLFIFVLSFGILRHGDGKYSLQELVCQLVPLFPFSCTTVQP